MTPNLIDAFSDRIYAYLNDLEVTQPPKLVYLDMETVDEYKLNHMFDQSNTIYLNLPFLAKIDFRFALLIVLHEAYHFTAQGISDIRDVNHLRDSKLWYIMQLCDVDADTSVVAYLKKIGDLPTFEDYISVLHKGGRTFHDQSVRIPKLERFIGSLTSIQRYYVTGNTTLFLPQIGYDSAEVFIVDYHYKRIKRRCLPVEVIVDWKTLYTEGLSMPCCDYTVELSKLTEKFLTIAA